VLLTPALSPTVPLHLLEDGPVGEREEYFREDCLPQASSLKPQSSSLDIEPRVTVALYIIGSIAACYVAWVFGCGVLITLGAEYEWSRGRRIRGRRAVLLGVALMLSFPLFAANVWALERIGLMDDFWQRAGLSAAITAIGYWILLRGVTRNLDAEEG
jgi:hypothetical protein